MKKALLKIVTGLLIGGIFLTGCSAGTQLPQGEDAAQSKEMQGGQSTEQGASEQDAGQTVENLTEDAPDAGAETEAQEETGISYTYEDMTITLPASWKDKYIIKDGQDGFAIMQKSSYEKEEGWGFLFGFYRSNEMVDESAGAQQLAYTDECVYYVQEPTDVTFWYEDEAISTEYSEMMGEKEAIVSSLAIDADSVRYDAREYVLPMSDSKPIPEYYLENFSSNQLWIARNEIFARHGRMFDNTYLSNYFASCSWYEGAIAATEFDESILSQTEKDNLEIIKQQEEKLASEKAYPQSCSFGETYKYDLNGDGRDEELCITYEENEANSVYDVQILLNGYMIIGDTVYNLSMDGVNYFSLNADEYFITDISPYYPGLEIAVMDYGMSDDLATHFYTFDDEFHYIGTVGGFPFKKYMNLDGFVWDGCVRGIIRTDLIHTCFSYANWHYDYDAKKLMTNEDQVFTMVPTGAYKLKKDIQVRTAWHPDAPMKTMKAQDIFFMETDGLEWIKIKGKDGSEGYLYIIDGKIDGPKPVDPQEVIEGLFFAG